MIALSLVVAIVATTPAVGSPRCEQLGPGLAVANVQAGFQRLDQLPPAAHVLTLYREVDRCLVPVVVRENIGSDRLASPNP